MTQCPQCESDVDIPTEGNWTCPYCEITLNIRSTSDDAADTGSHAPGTPTSDAKHRTLARLPISADATTSEAAEWWSVLQTPTGRPPAEWPAALADAIELYHERVDDQIQYNSEWNDLLDEFKRTQYPAGGCSNHGHTSYVPRCRHCTLPAECDNCGETGPIVRVEINGPDANDYDGAQPTQPTDNAPVRKYCASCCAREDLAPVAACSVADGGVNRPADELSGGECRESEPLTTPPTARPLVYQIENINIDSSDEGNDASEYDTSSHSFVAPVQRLPETPRGYLTRPPAWSGSKTPCSDPINAHRSAELPSREVTTVHRGYTDATVDTLRLGWAPGSEAEASSVVEKLLADGHSPPALIATGLFVPAVNKVSKRLHEGEAADVDSGSPDRYSAAEIATFELERLLGDETHPLTGADLLKPRWRGRYVVPHLVDAAQLTDLSEHLDLQLDEMAVEALKTRHSSGSGETTQTRQVPLFAHSIQQPIQSHPGDHIDSTYDAPTTTHEDGSHIQYVATTELPFGLGSIQPGEPVIMTTEPDAALTAIDAGLPAVAPVGIWADTAQHDSVVAALDHQDIKAIYAVEATAPSHGQLYPAAHSAVASVAANRTSLGEACDSAANVAADDDRQGSKPPVASTAGMPVASSSGRDWSLITAETRGLLALEQSLLEAGFEPIHMQLPRVTANRIDFDDYLSSNVCEYAPPLSSLRSLQRLLQHAGTEQDVTEMLIEANIVKQLSYEGEYIRNDPKGYQRDVAAGNRTGYYAESAPGRPLGEPEWMTELFERTVLGEPVPSEIDANGQPKQRNETATAGKKAESVDGAQPPVWYLRNRVASGETLSFDGSIMLTVSMENYFDYTDFSETYEQYDVDLEYTEEMELYKMHIGRYDIERFDDTICGPLLALGQPAVMTRGDARSSDATASIPRVNTVPIAANAGEFIESVEQHQTLSSFSDSETADETVYHETIEKPVLVSSPTLLHPRAHPQFAAMMDADAREFIERNRDIATPHVSGVSGTYNTALYDLTFAKITGCQIGGRHPNPLRDADARYALKLYSDYAGYDLSARASLNPLTWLLVAADERSIADPYGPLTPAEHLAAWLTAKREDLLPSRDSVPNTALVAAAIDLGLIERDQLIATDVLIPDNDIITLDGALPFAVYNETIRRFPDQYSVAPGRRQPVTEDAMQLQDVTRANFTQMFAQRFLTKQPRKFQTPLKSPRDSVSAVWALHECVRKANDIAAISATDPLRAPKQAIADAIEGVRKQSTTWYPGARSRPQLYVGARLTDAGRALALMHGIDIDDWQ